MATASSPNHLPQEVATCLQNARYLHLATSGGAWPHVSLMNYTYLPSTPYPLPPSPASSATSHSPGPVIILTLQPSTKKSFNLLTNPRVSLLVHDWVSHRASFSSASSLTSSSSPLNEQPAPHQPSSLASLLSNLNSASLSSISATLFGYAHVIENGTAEEQYYRRVHTENCVGAGESMCYLVGDDVRIVVVSISWARVADHKGLVKDWVAPGEEDAWEEFESGSGQIRGPANGA